MEMASTCNQRLFRPKLIAVIQPRKPRFSANEPAPIRFDLQSSTADQD
ncbi:hypothetical protein ALQ85_102176 [Pseudomonas syringae]|nr:hypothetical protein ALQ85_102176 [Pseudomonas syringae]